MAYGLWPRRRGAPMGSLALAGETFQLYVAVVDVIHRIGDQSMPRHLFDRPVHLVGHPSVGRMTGGLAAQLDEMERLTRVHLHDEPNVECEGHDILGDVGSQVVAQILLVS